jgi:hypothetical protein
VTTYRGKGRDLNNGTYIIRLSMGGTAMIDLGGSFSCTG